MKHDLKYRREFFRSFTPEDRQRDLKHFAPERSIGVLEGSFEEVNSKKLGPISRLTLLNPPDIRVNDVVLYMPQEGAKLFLESITGEVVRVGEPYDSGVFNVDLKVAIECRHCYDHDLGHGNHEECCHCSGEQKRNLNAPTHEVKTVPCEGCRVVFRPRTKPYRWADVEALLTEGQTLRLNGRTQDKAVLLDRCDNGDWNIRTPVATKRIKLKMHPWGKPDHDTTKRTVLQYMNTYLFGEPVTVGETFVEHINQGDRDCEVIEIKRTRYRIEFDMPSCTQQGWRTGIRIGNQLYYPVN